MTPQGSLPPNSNPASPELFNKVSSMGAQAGQGQESVDQTKPSGESEIEKLTKRFQLFFQQFQDFSSSYPGGDEESKVVANALANWFKSATSRINESSGSY